MPHNTTAPALMGANAAADVLEHCRAYGINGRLIRTTRGGRELREYSYLAEYVGGQVGMTTSCILASPCDHVKVMKRDEDGPASAAGDAAERSVTYPAAE